MGNPRPTYTNFEHDQQFGAKVSNRLPDVDKEVTKADIGLANVDDTSDASKPLSTPVATILNTFLQLRYVMAEMSQSGTNAPSYSTFVTTIPTIPVPQTAWTRTNVGRYSVTYPMPAFSTGFQYAQYGVIVSGRLSVNNRIFQAQLGLPGGNFVRLDVDCKDLSGNYIDDNRFTVFAVFTDTNIAL